MQLLYNSDSFAVLQIEFGQPDEPAAAATRGGYEIVDKLARKEIFLDGLMAESFRTGVQAIVECGPGKVLSGMVKRIDAEARTTLACAGCCRRDCRMHRCWTGCVRTSCSR